MQEQLEKILKPDWKEWPRILDENKRKRGIIQEVFTFCNIFRLKEKIITEARGYTESIYASAGFSFNNPETLSNGTDSSLLMTGHQPVIYHPGIMFKQRSLSRFTTQLRGAGHKVIAVNVIVDTDSGDAGEFLVPSSKGFNAESVTLNAVNAGGTGIFLGQQLAGEERILKVFQLAKDRIRSCGYAERVEAVRRAEAIYIQCRSKGVDLPAANFLVRHNFEQCVSYLELPFSRLVQMPEAVEVFKSLAMEPERLNQNYNSMLLSYRSSRKIKNKANPFPDLRTSDSQFELPFWLLDKETRTRHPLFARKGERENFEFFWGDEIVGRVAGGDFFLKEGHVLVPRAMLLTFFLRYFCSDGFIHGLGGASYDKFTDYFASTYLGLDSPDFMVASDTLYFFDRELKELRNQKKTQDLIRQILSNPEKLNEFYSEADQELQGEVSSYAAKKSELIAQLEHKKKNRQPAGEEGAALNTLKTNMKSLLEARLPHARNTFSPGDEEKILNRSFPFFMFF